MRRTVITILLVLVALGVLGYLAHTSDLLGLAKSLHGAAAREH